MKQTTIVTFNTKVKTMINKMLLFKMLLFKMLLLKQHNNKLTNKLMKKMSLNNKK